MYRKLQKTPTGTYFITLPKEWIESNNIKQGQNLEIEIRRDGALIVYPPLIINRSKVDTIVINYARNRINIIKDIIMSAYLLGYNMIKVISKKHPIDPRDREEIRRLIRFFIGLEIIDESDNEIIIQSILDPSYTDPYKLIRRMAYIVEDMLEDGFNALIHGNRKLAELTAQRDDEVNRVYFLLVRLLRGALRTPLLADKYTLDLIDYLDYRVAAKILESIGDLAATVKSYIKNESYYSDKALLEILNNILQAYRLAVDLFLKKNNDIRNNFNKSVEDLWKQINKLESKYRGVSEFMKVLLKEIIDLADLVVILPE